jgi:hypothetical protein
VNGRWIKSVQAAALSRCPARTARRFFTWLLLHKVPDWRWGMDGSSSFWYPSMRVFRQKERGNWNGVLEQVAAELQRVF